MTSDRMTYIVEACRGKQVLHLGCTDWPYTEKKLSTGTLLHVKINAVAASLVGVDADKDGVACFLKMGFPQTYVENVENFSQPEICRRTFEVIVAGEIIEHLENPGLFLRSIQKLMNPTTQLIITTT